MQARPSRRTRLLQFFGTEIEGAAPQGKPLGLPHPPPAFRPAQYPPRPHPQVSARPPPAYVPYLATRRSSAQRRTRHYRRCNAGRGPARTLSSSAILLEQRRKHRLADAANYDILVFEVDVVEHEQALRMVLKILQKRGLAIKKKCKIRVSGVEYLGH
ncbi:hypothetical protein NDU88_001973 [Pleurodeles waltl]|uniref:Uncharacterized protein n=1 Tax=Pleurodeles waltl TaxID=8319 RepID=A0AAV7LHJ5_PLEWA|nr:hypothetical protein NDU88_001973 [Pleurodeles waltl]